MAEEHVYRRTHVWAWIAFDWAAQPYFTLIATFVFPPFFVTFLAGDAVQGQRLWGWTMAGAAALVGIAAPLVGRYADGSQRLNGVFLATCSLAIFSSAALWFCDPKASSGLVLAVVLSIFCALGFELSTSLNNAMLLRYVQSPQRSRVAWIGWACGSASGILVLLLFIFVSSGLMPVIPSDFSTLARLSGPFTALWFLLFLLPLFLTFHSRTENSQIESSALPLSKPYSWRLLLSIMLYSNALLALFSFGGIYAAVVFHWAGTKLLLLSLILTIAGLTGVLAAIPLSQRFGTVSVALVASIAILFAGSAILPLEPERLFIWPSVTLEWIGITSSELCFLILAYAIGASSAALESSLRVNFLAQVSADRAGLSFGLFAFSGKSTSFLGPLLVSIAIGLFQSTKTGMIVIFILIGLATLFLLTEKKEAAHHSVRAGVEA